MNELPNGWVWAALPLVTSKITDGTHRSPENLPSGDYMYVTAKNIRPWGVDLSNVTYVSATVHHKIYSRCPVEQGDVLYIKDGATTGLAAVNHLKEPFSLLSSVALLKPRRDVLAPSFLKNWLNSPATLEAMVGKMTGTAIRRLTLKTISSQKIPLPPLPEQTRIVAKIDSLATRIACARNELARIPSLVTKYRSTVLELAFSGRLTADFRNEENYTAHGLPDSWGVRPLGEISEIQGGIQVGKKRSGSVTLVDAPYLRVANVQRGWLDLNEVKTIGVTPEEKARLLLRKGDVLMNEGGDRDKLGRGWVWDEQIAECIHQNHVFRIRLNANILPPEFVSHFANERGQQYFFDEGTQTTNLASISKRKVAALPVPVPPFDEAREIVRRIEVAFAWLDRIGADHACASKLLPKLNSAILTKAFHGELVPQNPNDEQAGKLLERVKAERLEQPRGIRGRTPRAVPITEELMTVGKNLEQVLMEAGDWVPAQTAFQRCGIGDGASTEDIERIYAQLRDLDALGKLEAEAVTDSHGRKLHDRIRLKAA